MGEILDIEPVRPLAGLLATDLSLLECARRALEKDFGKIIKATEPELFKHTAYYAPEMGKALYRQFIIFEGMLDAALLADWKLAANHLEQEVGLNDQKGRRINVDPGYLAPGKLVLASTKDHGHRLYLRNGIYAEMTMKIQKKKFTSYPWTYPDYAEASPFFNEAYEQYLEDLRAIEK